MFTEARRTEVAQMEVDDLSADLIARPFARVVPEGTFLAAVCTVGGPEIADRLDEVGRELLDAIRQWSFTRPARAVR